MGRFRLLLSLLTIVVASTMGADPQFHAVRQGDIIEIGKDGKGKCEYDGSNPNSPVWLLNKGLSTSVTVSSATDKFPSFEKTTDITVTKSWDRYVLRIDTKNTTLAGKYTCQHSNIHSNIYHYVTVLSDEVKCRINKTEIELGKEFVAECVVQIWGTQGGSHRPTMSVYSTKQNNNTRVNESTAAEFEEKWEGELVYVVRRNITKEDHGKFFHCNMASMPGWPKGRSFPKCETKTAMVVNYRPEFVKALNASLDRWFIGETIQGVCETVGRPKPTLTWRKNGKGFGAGDVPKMDVEVTKDLKSLSCFATSNLGQNISTVNVTILYPPEVTSLRVDPDNVPENQLTEVHCDVEPQRLKKFVVIKMFWVENGKMEEFNKTTVKATRQMNRKRFMCAASITSSNGTVKWSNKTTAPIYVSFGPDVRCEPFKVKPSTGDHEVTCYLEGNPRPRLNDAEWLLGTREIQEVTQFKDGTFKVKQTEEAYAVKSILTMKADYIYEKQSVSLNFSMKARGIAALTSRQRLKVVFTPDADMMRRKALQADVGVAGGAALGVIFFLSVLVLVTYCARKRSCWTECMEPDGKPAVVTTAYTGTIDRHGGPSHQNTNGNAVVASANGKETVDPSIKPERTVEAAPPGAHLRASSSSAKKYKPASVEQDAAKRISAQSLPPGPAPVQTSTPVKTSTAIPSKPKETAAAAVPAAAPSPSRASVKSKQTCVVPPTELYSQIDSRNEPQSSSARGGVLAAKNALPSSAKIVLPPGKAPVPDGGKPGFPPRKPSVPGADREQLNPIFDGNSPPAIKNSNNNNNGIKSPSANEKEAEMEIYGHKVLPAIGTRF